MCHYKHLTLEEREKLLYFSAQGYSVTEIAEELKRNKSTISRELRRNRDGKLYLPVKAQQMYSKRRKACRPRKRLDDPALFQTVKESSWSTNGLPSRLPVGWHWSTREASSATQRFTVLFTAACLTWGNARMDAGVLSASSGTGARHGTPSLMKNGVGKSRSAMTSANALPAQPTAPA